jgi:hypothetical protein
MTTKLEVMVPSGEQVVKKRNLSPRLDTLENKTICEVWNSGFLGETSFPIIREMLQKRFPGVKIIPYDELPRTPIIAFSPKNKMATLEGVRVALKERGCDALITGNGG